MSFEAELKSRYSQVHQKFFPPARPRIKRPRRPDPKNVFSSLPTLPTQFTPPSLPTAIPPKPRYTLAMLMQFVAQKERVAVGDIKAHIRNPAATVARMIFYYLAHVVRRAPSTQVGRIVDRDHSTVLTGIDRLKTHCEANPSLKARLFDYEAYVNSVDCGDTSTEAVLCPLCPHRNKV